MTGLTRFALTQFRLTATLMALIVFGGIATYFNQPSQ